MNRKFTYYILVNLTSDYPVHLGINTTYPAQLFIFQGQNTCAFCEELHFDHRPRVGGGEISLGSPSAMK
jgi:hypothetical protein